MTLSVSIVVGNPRAQSRTREVATALVRRLLEPGTYDLQVIDLADHADEIFRWPSEPLDALGASVAASDLVVFASPTYKASYTGLLKGFLDRYSSGGLRGVTAIPLLTGADLGHSLGVSVHLASLLTELGAVVPGRGFYFVTGDMDRLDEIVDAAATEYARNIAALTRVGAALAPVVPQE